jgi:ATP-binding cassette subfamily B protein
MNHNSVAGPLRSFGRDQSVKDVKVAPGTAKRVLQFARPYARMLIVFMLVVIADAVVSASSPLLYRLIINKGIAVHRADVVVHISLVVGGLAILDALLTLVQRNLSARIAQGLVFDMRTQVFARVQQMSLAFFTRVKTGALVSRLNGDVNGAKDAFTDVLSTVVGNLITVVLVLIAMFALSWQLTLVALLLVPAFVLPARFMGKKLQEIAREGYDLSSEMNSTMVERFNVSGALLAKLFGRPDEEDREFKEKAARVRELNVRQMLYTRFFYVSLGLTASLAVAFVYGWGGLEAVRGTLDVGTVVALASYLNRLYSPLTSLSNLSVDVLTALVSFERIFEVLDLKPMVTEKPDAVALPQGPARIEFQEVSFAYPSAEEVSLASLETVAVLDTAKEKQVLNKVSFVAEPGQLIALVGPSGAGKTTITQLVARLYDVRSGAIKINGIDLRDATLNSLRSAIGMVTQDSHMYHDTVRANLLYGRPDATEEQLLECLESAQILKLVQSLPDGLDTMLGERGYRLSGGEKQRLAIARLLLKAPNIVVLDEATAHLDSESERLIQQAFETALAGRTSLVVAHRLSTILKADQILVVRDGKIAEHGRHSELLEQDGLYAELYRTQFADQQKES